MITTQLDIQIMVCKVTYFFSSIPQFQCSIHKTLRHYSKCISHYRTSKGQPISAINWNCPNMSFRCINIPNYRSGTFPPRDGWKWYTGDMTRITKPPLKLMDLLYLLWKVNLTNDFRHNHPLDHAFDWPLSCLQTGHLPPRDEQDG